MPPAKLRIARLEQELQQDVAPAGAEREADADVLGPLGDGDQHDVHDADAADQQRHRGDRDQAEAHRVGDALHQHQVLVERLDLEAAEDCGGATAITSADLR